MASPWVARIRVFFTVTAVIVAVNVARQLYRWFAFEDERVELVRLTAKIEDAALEVMRTQLHADSLRNVIERMDVEVGTHRSELAGLERRAEAGGLPPMLYQEYRRGLDDANDLIARRNQRVVDWRTVVDRNHRSVRRYNLLADSIRGLGERMGEPYLSIPSPAEVATRHGLRAPERPAAASSVPPLPD